MKKAQIEELCTKYGPIEFFWMDRAVGDGGLSHRETVNWIHQFQPNCFVGFNTGETAGRFNLRKRGKPCIIGDKNAVWNEGHLKDSYENLLVAEFTCQSCQNTKEVPIGFTHSPKTIVSACLRKNFITII